MLQFLFHDQWTRLRRRAHERGIAIIGDLPIFVAHDSADVWCRPDLFELDAVGRPTVVAGVPPDYFSQTGQRWGNPLYRWDVHEEQRYDWWIARLAHAFALVDVLRIDHFRGFAGYWEIPGDHPTAEHGRWLPGPGRKLFDAVAAALGPRPIIAEDLGVITPDVDQLRDDLGFPGMRILQFAFGGSALPDGTYDIFEFTGSSNGSLASVESSGFYAGTWTALGSGTYQLVRDAQTITFSQSSGDVIVVPEPTTITLAAVGLGAMAYALGRRRRLA